MYNTKFSQNIKYFKTTISSIQYVFTTQKKRQLTLEVPKTLFNIFNEEDWKYQMQEYFNKSSGSSPLHVKCNINNYDDQSFLQKIFRFFTEFKETFSVFNDENKKNKIYYFSVYVNYCGNRNIIVEAVKETIIK